MKRIYQTIHAFFYIEGNPGDVIMDIDFDGDAKYSDIIKKIRDKISVLYNSSYISFSQPIYIAKEEIKNVGR